MTISTRIFLAAAATGLLAVPAAAQYYPQPTYPQQYPNQYPNQQQAYPGTGYGQQGYAPQGYAPGYSQNPIQQVIDSLLGNRYNVTDRQAVSRCASAALTQAQAQYRPGVPYGSSNAYNYNNRQGGYGQAYAQPYGNAGNNYAQALRVTSISEVERRRGGLRVSGTIGGAYANRAYGNQYGNQGQAYAANNLSFRCNVDYSGAVTGVRVRDANAYRG